MPKMSTAHLKARQGEILDAAETCFIRKGLHQTTMHDICEEARLSPGAVYRYFASKEELIDAVAERRIHYEMQLISEAQAETSEAVEALTVLGDKFWSQFCRPDFERWARLDIEIWPETLRNPRQQARSRERRSILREALTEICRQAVEQGAMWVEADPVTMANLLMSLFRGLQLHKAIDPTVNTQEIIDLLQLMLKPSESREQRSAAAVAAS
jgi:AcrR family transcriptional regulator